MTKNIVISLAASCAIIVGVVYLLLNAPEVAQTQNVEIRDGVQYVTITASAGYSPRLSEIQPNIPTRLIVRTDNTFDCSIALVVESANFRGMLKPTGEKVIDLGTPKPGDKIQGACTMWMYYFQIKVNQS